MTYLMSITNDCKANRLFTRLTLRGLKKYVHIGGRPHRRETMAGGLGGMGELLDSVIDIFLVAGSARARWHAP